MRRNDMNIFKEIFVVPFYWELVGTKGANSYYENTITGKRKVWDCHVGGYTPIDYDWVNGVEKDLFRERERPADPLPMNVGKCCGNCKCKK